MHASLPRPEEPFSSQRRRAALLAAALLLGPAARGALAQGGPARPLTPQERTAKARAYFTDTPLQVHDGRTVRFFSDVLQDRVVLINFVFTGCGEACPLITQKVLHARQLLGPEAGQVRFVSISIDPENDTPKTLSQFAAKQGALAPDWLWLTGKKSHVDTVTQKLGAYTDNPQSHFTGLIVGNLRTDRWTKVRPDAASTLIAAELRRIGEFARPAS